MTVARIIQKFINLSKMPALDAFIATPIPLITLTSPSMIAVEIVIVANDDFNMFPMSLEFSFLPS